MIGNGYWATGITVSYGYCGRGEYGWRAEIEFFDDGWVDDEDTDAGNVSTQGALRTRYAVRDGNDADALTVAVGVVKADAERLGVILRPVGGVGPFVYYQDDGDSEEHPPPDGWRDLVNAQSVQLGWQPPYRSDQAAQ